MARILTVSLLALMLFASACLAEERLGVPVYPGATFDPVRTKLLAKDLSMEGAAFRTSDDIGKVKIFYQKQGLVFLKIGGTSHERARFKSMQTNTDVVIQQPWQDPQTKAMMKDTLILILREKGQ